MAILEIKDAKKVLENAPEGAEYWTPGYDVEYRKRAGDTFWGYVNGKWEITHDKELSQERIDKGWWFPNLREMVNDAESVDGVEVTTVATQDEEFGLPFVVEDNEEFPLIQQVGRGLRKLEPQDGEWWLCECKKIPGKVDGYSYESALFFESEAWFFDSEANKPIPFDAAPLYRLYMQEEFDAKSIECQEHAATVTKLSEGLSIITDACKKRGLGDRPFVDIIHLLEKAENPLVTTYQDHVYPLVDGAWYMCEWKRNDGKRIATPVLWKFGGFYSESEALSQTDNDIKVLYRMAEAKPQEMVTLQLDSLPAIGSIVYIKPNREPGDGQPGFKSDNAERKVKIHSHFTDDRGIDLAAYVSCDDKHPLVGGVACATAFETEFEKAEREKEEWFKEVANTIGYSDDEKSILEEMYRLNYRRMEGE